MYKRALAALVALVAIVVVAAGCGGGSDSTSSAGETAGGEAPTKAVFIKEADAICKSGEDALEGEVEEFVEEEGLEKKKPTPAQETQLVEQLVIPNIARQGEEIGELTPPEGEEETIEELVSSLQEGVESAEEEPKALIEGGNPFAAATKQAKAYGMKECGTE